MAYNFPFEMFLQAAQQKASNQRNMYSDIAGIGEGLGQSVGAVGDIMAQKKKQAALQNLMAMLKQSGQPQEGPQMPGLPQAGAQGPGMPQTSGGGMPFTPDRNQITAAAIPAFGGTPAGDQGILQMLTKGMGSPKANLGAENLAEKQREFGINTKLKESYQAQRKQYQDTMEFFKAKGDKLAYARAKAGLAKLDADHYMLYNLFGMESPGQAFDDAEGSSGGGNSSDPLGLNQ